MSAEDYYNILGVSKNATDEEIKTAYRKLVFEYHPDKNSSAYAEERIKEINLAYSVLSDPEKRAEYDRGGIFGPGQARPGSGYSRSSEKAGEGFYWKKEYTWSWGGQANSGSRNGRYEAGASGNSEDSGNSGNSKQSYASRTGPARASGKKGKGNPGWDAVDMILRLFGIFAVFWLIVRRPMFAVLLVITAAFLLAAWAFIKNLMMVSGRKK